MNDRDANLCPWDAEYSGPLPMPAARSMVRGRVARGARTRANLAAMVSMAHEILVDLFRNRPSLAAEILVEALGVGLLSYTDARLASIDRTQVQPAEYLADVVVRLLDGDVPVRVLIVEVATAPSLAEVLDEPS